MQIGIVYSDTKNTLKYVLLSPQQGLSRKGKINSLRWTSPSSRKAYVIGERMGWMDKPPPDHYAEVHAIELLQSASSHKVLIYPKLFSLLFTATIDYALSGW